MDTFYLAIGTAIFVGILGYFGVHKLILGALDRRAAKVQEQLDQAAALRAEAQKLLTEYEAKRAAAEKDAAQIVADAQAEAERIKADQELKLAEFVARRTKMAEMKIAQAEATALAEVRAAATDAAVRAAGSILSAEATGKLGDQLIATGLKEARARLG
jgi:F-type H+-transporting ATPase subunit b